MYPDREHFGEINVQVQGTTRHDAERILQTAVEQLKGIVGLEVMSVYIVNERLVYPVEPH